MYRGRCPSSPGYEGTDEQVFHHEAVLYLNNRFSCLHSVQRSDTEQIMLVASLGDSEGSESFILLASLFITARIIWFKGVEPRLR